MIRLKADAQIKAVFSKTLEVMGARVEWDGTLIVLGNSMILPGTLKSLIFSFDNQKVVGTVVDLKESKEEPRLMLDNTMLENAFNMLLYIFGKWGQIKGLTVEKNYDQLQKMINGVLHDIDAEARFSSDRCRFYQDGIQLSFEEVIEEFLDLMKPEELLQEEENDQSDKSDQDDIKKDSDEQDEDEEEDGLENERRRQSGRGRFHIGIWHKLVWKVDEASFTKEQLSGHDRKKKRIGRDYYLSNYKCPDCGKFLFMVVYPEGKEHQIETEEGAVLLARTYTCSACHSFYTPRPEYMLMDGHIYTMEFGDDVAAYEDYLELTGKDGALTSNGNLNRYVVKPPKKNETVDAETSILEDSNESSQQEYYESEQRQGRDAKERQGRDAIEHKENDAKERQSILTKERKDSEADSKQGKTTGLRQEKQKADHNKSKTTRRSEKEIAKRSASMAAAGRGASKNAGMEFLKQIVELQKMSDEDVLDIKDRMDSGFYSPEIVSQYEEDLSKELHHRKIFTSSTKDKMRVSRDKQRKKEKDPQTRDGQTDNSRITLRESSHSAKSADDMNGGDGLSNKTEHIIKESGVKKDPRQMQTEMLKKAVEVRNGSYVRIRTAYQEIEESEAPQEIKEPILSNLRNWMNQRAKTELDAIVKGIPVKITKAQYESFSGKISQYPKELNQPAQEILNQKRDEAEKLEVATYVKKNNTRPNNRNSLYELYESLKKQGFRPEIVEPFLSKIHDKIYDMDLSEIRKLCPDPMDVSFHQGIEAAKQIKQENFLPELKEDVLGRIDLRLRMMRRDECLHLVAKFKKDMDWSEQELPAFVPYDLNRMEKEENHDKDTILIRNSQNTYADPLDEYEYPLMICDTTHGNSGKKGFLLTPDHIYYSSGLSNGVLEIPAVKRIYVETRLLNKGIYADYDKVGAVKLAGQLKNDQIRKDRFEECLEKLNEFIDYLKEKPISRSVEYMAKEEHEVKCCYRCGFVYRGGDICPKCGSRNN